MNTIIAPTDFSPASLNAVNYAADMAVATNAELLILHATELPFDKNFFSDTYEESEIEKTLIELKKKLLKTTQNKIIIKAKQLAGTIENELIKICAYKSPFAVVMATHGASLRKLLFVGSITVYLSRNLKYPVIVVPENVHFKPVHNIALATDLKNIDELPVEKILSVITAFKAQLSLVYVYSGKEDLNEYAAEKSALHAHFKELNPAFHFVQNDNVQSGIVSFAEKNNIDIILTFPKKHTLFHSSESKQLIFHSPVTVMTLH